MGAVKRFVAFLLVLAGCRTVVDPPAPSNVDELGVASTVDPSSEADDEPGDVEPLTPDDRGSYSVAVREVLLGDRHGELESIRMPSFEPESALVIRRGDRDGGWVLETARAERMIYGVAPSVDDPGRMRVVHRRDVDVELHSIPLDDATAEAVLDAWDLVVRRARYPKPRIHVENGHRVEVVSQRLDGTVHHFASGPYVAKTWSPRPGLAADLVDLADEMCALASAPAEERVELTLALVEHAHALRAAAEALRW